MMRASYLVRPGALELRQAPVPAPARGEVLVRVEAALTCGTDLKAYLRGHPMIPMPGVCGHEFSGVVARVGAGVKKVKEGDAVMAVHSAPCLACRYCRKRLFNLCENIMASKVMGAFAEYVLLPSHIVTQNLFRKPEGLGFEEAAFLEPLSCVVHGMRGVSIGRGETALVIGAGPIGLLHLLLLKQKGAQVVMTGLEPQRLDLARALGADAVVPPSALDRFIPEYTDGLGVDVVFECTGQLAVWEAAVSYVRRGGTVVLFGGVKQGTVVTYDTYRLHYDEVTLKGVFHFTPQEVKEAYTLLAGGVINVAPLISGRYPLEGLPEALEKLAKGEGIKYAIMPQGLNRQDAR